MLELARQHPRYGYRRITALLRQEGWRVNRKRVQRLWREQGLKVPQKQSKRRRLGSSEQGSQRRRAERINQVWSYDFVMDQTEDGRRLKMLPIVDEYSRECLEIEVSRSLTAEDVVKVLLSLLKCRIQNKSRLELAQRETTILIKWRHVAVSTKIVFACTYAVPGPSPAHRPNQLPVI